MEPGNSTVFQLLDPLCWFKDPVAKGDEEVGHLPVILDVPVRGSFKYVFIVLHAIVESADLLVEVANFAVLLGIASGNGHKEPLCDGLEDVGIEVRVCRQCSCNGTGHVTGLENARRL